MSKKFLIPLLVFMTLLSPAAHSQSRVDSAALRAMQVGRVMQQERVYLHFDNSAYYIGETMWFKAYVSFGSDNRPSTLSKVLYVELVAPEGYVVETKKYKLDDNGCCHGEFDLNPLLLSGYYEVRAYTRYMLNWEKDAVFSRVFPVFDKVNANNWDFKNMLDRRRSFLDGGEWVSHELPAATLNFFPEGGHLVAGLPARVAFELREEDGLFSEEKITVTCDGAKVLESVPVHLGKGLFEFTPQAGKRYLAEAVIKDSHGKEKRHTFDLPEIASEGAVMRVDEHGDSIEITVMNNFSDARTLGFVVLHRGTMGFFRRLDSSAGTSRLTLSRNELPEGVNRAVLFEDDGRPFAERQFFITHDTLQPGSHGTVKLRVLANGFHTHNLTPSPNEKITVKVVREDGKPIPSGTALSLSLSDAAGHQATSYTHNIYTYLLLGSELKGYLPDAAQYFDPTNSRRKEHLDLVMLTHGWTSYSWDKLARKKIENIQPIERGITVKGRFLMKQTDTRMGHKGEALITPMPYNLVRLDFASDGENVKMSTFRTDSVGGFVLGLDDFYGTSIASLKPQTVFKHSQNIAYQFALDRYYSPGARLYDYWERHLGAPMSKSDADSLVRLNPFEYMLSSVEVVARRNKEMNSRPPHSEMRLNYLDEWEYAQDVTYLNLFNREYDEVNDKLVTDMLHDETRLTEVKDADPMIFNPDLTEGTVQVRMNDKGIDRYIGFLRYIPGDPGRESGASEMPVDHEFDHVLTAQDVIRSAIRRHGYHWAYWVQLMVVDGEYSPNEVPAVDKEYLRGVADVEKMTNFKEFVIRSDEGIRTMFENNDNYWRPLSFMLDNKTPVQKFYMGFLSQLYIYPGDGVDGAPNLHAFSETLTNGYGSYSPKHPNYVACLIPYTDEERGKGIVPEFAATGSSLRYTSVQGYSESKKFYSPDYGRMRPQESDYRRTLLWVPDIEINDKGEAVMELYNSSTCTALTASVEGRNGRVLFSNGETITTRGGDIAVQGQGAAPARKEEDVIIEETIDPELRKACDAEQEKGVIYYNQKRYKDAIMIFAELVQYKYPPALYYVGRCYRDGTGVSRNEKLALQFMLEAARRNEPAAQYELAMMLFEGEVVQRDEAKGLEWLARATDNGEPRAMLETALRLRDGNGMAPDTGKSNALLEKAALAGLPAAMHEHGMRLLGDGGDGLQFIIDAAAAQHEPAMVYMLEHEHNAGNYKEAYKYAKKLSLIGNHHGTKRMGDYYMEGNGVKRDKSLARDLYREAAANGNAEAKRILEGK